MQRFHLSELNAYSLRFLCKATMNLGIQEHLYHEMWVIHTKMILSQNAVEYEANSSIFVPQNIHILDIIVVCLVKLQAWNAWLTCIKKQREYYYNLFTIHEKLMYSLRPILHFANTDVSITKMCLDSTILVKSIMSRREYTSHSTHIPVDIYLHSLFCCSIKCIIGLGMVFVGLMHGTENKRIKLQLEVKRCHLSFLCNFDISVLFNHVSMLWLSKVFLLFTEL